MPYFLRAILLAVVFATVADGIKIKAHTEKENAKGIESVFKAGMGSNKGVELQLKKMAKSRAKKVPSEEQLSFRQYTPGSDGTYSQNYQDVWFEKLVKHNNWENGFFLDLGAFHGTFCSNSKLLEERHGFNGVCAEPNPEQNFYDRSCALVSRPLDKEAGKSMVWAKNGMASKLDGAAELDEVHETRVTTNITEILRCVNEESDRTGCDGLVVGGRNTMEVPKLIHVASLDVEGVELPVLKGFPWDTHEVGAWVVEHNFETEKREAIKEYLEGKGYIRTSTENAGVDDYYVLKRYWDQSLAAKDWRIHPDGFYC